MKVYAVYHISSKLEGVFATRKAAQKYIEQQIKNNTKQHSADLTSSKKWWELQYYIQFIEMPEEVLT